MTLNTNRSTRRLALGSIIAAAASATILLATGCEGLGYIAYQLEQTKEVEIPAQYSGLHGKRFAVLIDAPMDIMYEYPGAYEELTALISYNLPRFLNGEHLESDDEKEKHEERASDEAEAPVAAPAKAEAVPPQVVLAYQNSNVYWATMDYVELARELGAERLVLIDLVEYRLNAPGNSYIWDGLIRADVHIVEADSFDASSFAYSMSVTTRYPTVDGVSRSQVSPAVIHKGLRLLFTEKVVRLFHDHVRINHELQEELRQQ